MQHVISTCEMIATIDTMLEDVADDASWRAHFGDPPNE
jgi:hypothetical protein